MVADLEHQPNMPPMTNPLIPATNCTPLMEIKKLPTHVHSTDGCSSRASAQHATQDKFTESRDNCTRLIEIKKIPTHVHSTGGCRSRVSAQHATQD